MAQWTDRDGICPSLIATWLQEPICEELKLCMSLIASERLKHSVLPAMMQASRAPALVICMASQQHVLLYS